LGTEPVGRSGTEPEIVVIPHGVDHARFHPEADDSCDVARLDALGVRAPYVAFLGTIEPRKDVASLVGAFARLASAQPDLRLVVAGGRGWDDDAVRTAIERSGVAHRIVRTGYLPDDTVPALLRRASVVVYPSLEEGFGLPALEALACGAPLVSTTGSSIEEFVGDAGLLVPPGDPDALAGALERALDPTVAADLARRGPVQVAGYTWEAAAAAHVDAYRHARARRS
jgi:glycosyltransferase involved in cell wall biosynthesis